MGVGINPKMSNGTLCMKHNQSMQIGGLPEPILTLLEPRPSVLLTNMCQIIHV